MRRKLRIVIGFVIGFLAFPALVAAVVMACVLAEKYAPSVVEFICRNAGAVTGGVIMLVAFAGLGVTGALIARDWEGL